MRIRYLTALAAAAVFVTAASAQTGTAVSGLENFDYGMTGLMNRWQVPGASLAIVQGDKLVFARGYGLADRDTGELVQPDSLFRICSISKPLTAAGILRLVEDGKLSLDAKAFEILSDLQPLPGLAQDPRISQITVRHLLQHRSGWDDRRLDPAVYQQVPYVAAQTFGVRPPASPEIMIRYALGTVPLTYDPGTTYAYSNFGYLILGRIIERASGQSYECYIRDHVLAPMGITRMSIGGSFLAERSSAEVHYYDYPGAPLVPSVFPDWPKMVPDPYGGQDYQGQDSFGGWIGSAIDLVRFAASLDGRLAPRLLQADTIRTMLARPEGTPASATWWYGLGWVVSPVGSDFDWSHDGHHQGSRTYLIRRADGRSMAMMFNTAPAAFDQFLQEAVNMLLQNETLIRNWPTQDLFPRYASPEPPKVPAAGVVSAANYSSGVAPGEFVALFGTHIGPAPLAGLKLNGDGKVDTSLSDTRVIFDNTPAPLIYASDGQTSAVVPYAVAGAPQTRVRVEYRGVRSAAVTVPVLPSAPGIFSNDQSGTGQGAILNQDYSRNSAANPAARGSYVFVFATGEGQTDPAGVDGLLATGVLPIPLLPVSATVGGILADVQYAGAAPGMVAGVLQVNVKIPGDVASGDVPLVITVGEASSSPNVTVAVR